MRKSNSFCSIRYRICRAFQLPITCGHYIAECHLPTFYAHIISVIMCEKYFCARCIAECAILPCHCEYQEKLFGKTPSRFYSKTNQSSLLSLCVRGQWRFEGGVFSSFALQNWSMFHFRVVHQPVLYVVLSEIFFCFSYIEMLAFALYLFIGKCHFCPFKQFLRH